jgi:branched-subunit amino acid transport protein
LGLILQGFILYQGFRGRLLSRYPLFYLYISSSLLGSGMMSVVFFTHPESHAAWYWPTQYVTMLAGCGLIIEMLRYIPFSYRDTTGLATITRYVLLAVVVCFLAACFLTPGVFRVVAIDVLLERDFRLAQALILLFIAAIVFRYELPIGRNVKGIFLGYGLYVGASLVTLAVDRYAGSRFDAVWAFVQPFSYTVSHVIWLVTLWRFYPGPILQMETKAQWARAACSKEQELGRGATRPFGF